MCAHACTGQSEEQIWAQEGQSSESEPTWKGVKCCAPSLILS